MGARVIAAGRNLETLQKLQASQENGEIDLFQITGDVNTDLNSLRAFGTIDAFLDLSPPEAANSTHFKTCMLSLRKGGRVSLMGGLNNELTIPVKAVVSRDLKIMGKWMYERQDVRDMIKMIEIGVLKLGGKEVETFGLEEWEKAFERAAELGGVGRRGATIIVP
jgi:threonine dehydrogenase-like Zn-dependent dehydrogenase